MPSPRPKSVRAAAFFDLDKTLIDTDAGFEFANHLLELARIERDQAVGGKKKELTRAYRAFVREVYAKFLFYVPLYKMRLVKRSHLIRESYTFYRDQDKQRFLDALDAFFEKELKGRVYPAVRPLLDRHRSEGRTTVLLTSGMQPIAERYAALLGIDRAEGVRLMEQGGRLTGEVYGPLYGGDKAELAQKLADDEGWDLADCYAYTDHDSDRHLLEIVGHPHAVHPNRRLARIAKRNDWPVLDFREARL